MLRNCGVCRSEGWEAQARVEVRVGERLLWFTDEYLRLECERNYQEWHMHVDPVCRMRLTGSAVVQIVEHSHWTFYFYSDACRARFAEDAALCLAGQVPLDA